VREILTHKWQLRYAFIDTVVLFSAIEHLWALIIFRFFNCISGQETRGRFAVYFHFQENDFCIVYLFMTGRTHDAIAFASLVTIAALNPPANLNVATATAAIVGNIIGATLPDIDQSTNRLWDFLPGRDYLGKLLRPLFLGHRNLTHSLLGVFLVYHGLGFILPRILNPVYVEIDVIYISMMIGYVSHLVGDAITKEGLPLLFPFGWRFGFPPISAFRITSGKWVENIVILPGTAAYIFWFIGNHHEEFVKLFRLMSGN